MSDNKDTQDMDAYNEEMEGMDSDFNFEDLDSILEEEDSKKKK